MSRASEFYGAQFCFSKFNQLYLGTGCVCFFGREGGREHPLGTGTRGVIKI